MLRRLSHLRFRQSIFHTLQTRGHIIFVTGRILINVGQNAGREGDFQSGRFTQDDIFRELEQIFKEVGVTRCRVVQSAP